MQDFVHQQYEPYLHQTLSPETRGPPCKNNEKANKNKHVKKENYVASEKSALQPPAQLQKLTEAPVTLNFSVAFRS